MAHYSIGLDFGTNSVRALLVRTGDGAEVASHVQNYRHGNGGVIEDGSDPNLARQHPRDYLDGAEETIRRVLRKAAAGPDFDSSRVIGIGVDTTGSTPLPVDEAGTPLAFRSDSDGNPNALAWLWKDHTAVAEAEEITRTTRRKRPEYLTKYGGVYSAEWYWSKLLHGARVDPELFAASSSWLEVCDWIPAQLCGIHEPRRIKRSICAAGHKALYNPEWGGFPDERFLGEFHPELARIRRTLPERCYSVREKLGELSAEWAERTGLPAGIPVAVGAFDAHLGGVGAGIGPGTMVKSIGTSTCDVMVQPFDREIDDIPGLCGIVPESILPEAWGLEAGQSAVGDTFNWYVHFMQEVNGGHEELTARSERLTPGESGLLALDWHNGNRSVLADQRLTGAIAGLTLHTRPEEIYRALVEATAFGARVILERFEEYAVPVERIITCGGIATKNRMLMQIYADVLKRPLRVSRTDQAAALGAAIAGAVVAGGEAGGHDDVPAAIREMTGVRDLVYEPAAGRASVYDRLYTLYRSVHDAFGGVRRDSDLSRLMKELITIREEARNRI